MVEASGLLTQARMIRQLSMNTLAEVSGVPVSTISRIESGKVEPTWSTMGRILTAAGFQLEASLTEAGGDEPFARALRHLDEAPPTDRATLIRRFPSIARLAPVARRRGARRVELTQPFGDAIDTLNSHDESPVVSSLEAYARDVGRTRSFTPVVYVDDPAAVDGFNPATRTSPTVLFLLPTTDNVRTFARDVEGVPMVSREWAILDSLASPGRQPDATVYLLDDLTLDRWTRRVAGCQGT
jgi:transcriptional regulator with XRE-family HTH domain